MFVEFVYFTMMTINIRLIAITATVDGHMVKFKITIDTIATVQTESLALSINILMLEETLIVRKINTSRVSSITSIALITIGIIFMAITKKKFDK